MKVERNKRFGFNLVEGREGFHCGHWRHAHCAKTVTKTELCAKYKDERQFGCAKLDVNVATIAYYGMHQLNMDSPFFNLTLRF